MASHATLSRLEVESWGDVGVLAWGSKAAFSGLNRPAIIEFLRGGITGRILLELGRDDLIQLKVLSFGAPTELVLAIRCLRSELDETRHSPDARTTATYDGVEASGGGAGSASGIEMRRDLLAGNLERGFLSPSHPMQQIFAQASRTQVSQRPLHMLDFLSARGWLSLHHSKEPLSLQSRCLVSQQPRRQAAASRDYAPF